VASRRQNAHSIQLFATSADLVGVFSLVEAALPLSYAEAGMFDQAHFVTYCRLQDIPNLGSATTGDQAREATYLVAARPVAFALRSVPQRSGGIHFALAARGESHRSRSAQWAYHIGQTTN
jgi:hypothetical protein